MSGSGGSWFQTCRRPACAGGLAPHAMAALSVVRRPSAPLMLCIAMLAAAGTSACAGPRTNVQVQPPTATLLVDGVSLPPLDAAPATAAAGSAARGGGAGGGADVPFVYYGTIAVTAVPQSPAPATPLVLRQPVHELVPLPPPAPGWLFPFDFLVDAIGWPWRADAAANVSLRLPPAGPEPQAGIEPPEADALRSRARAMRTER